MTATARPPGTRARGPRLGPSGPARCRLLARPPPRGRGFGARAPCSAQPMCQPPRAPRRPAAPRPPVLQDLSACSCQTLPAAAEDFGGKTFFVFLEFVYLNPRAAPQLCHGGRPARLGRERRRLVWGRMPWTRGPPCSDNSWQRGRRSVSPTETHKDTRRRAVSCPWPPCIVSHRPSAAAARLALRTHPPLCLLSPLPPHVQLAALAACRSPAWVPSPFLESLPMMFLTNSASLKYDVDT